MNAFVGSTPTVSSASARWIRLSAWLGCAILIEQELAVRRANSGMFEIYRNFVVRNKERLPFDVKAERMRRRSLAAVPPAESRTSLRDRIVRSQAISKRGSDKSPPPRQTR